MNWEQQVNKVFYTTPRDGYKSGNLWIERSEEKLLSAYLEKTGVSVCIDGPTGTGKSSLAITILKKKKIDFLLIQVTKNMTWKDFCTRLLQSKKNQNNIFDSSIELGIEKGLPTFKVKLGLTSADNSIDDLELEQKMTDRLTDHKICEILKEENLTLLIDDFERAKDDILSNIGEMCKLLTETYIKQDARIIIVGTDDIYGRLVKFNKALEQRLREISLGTIANRLDSWNFLIKGFEKLGLSHVEADFKINRITRAELQQCKDYCFEAADGLLKSLNELGSDIAGNGKGRNRISKSDIISTCKTYPSQNIKTYIRDFPKIAQIISTNHVIKSLLIHLYNVGIGRIHSWDEICSHFHNEVEYSQIENALCELVNIDFLTRTGHNGEVLFVSNPTLAHTLGVVLTHPNKYEIPKSLKLNNGQLVLPLLNRIGHTDPDKEV